MESEEPLPLLELPDPCLVAVLRCCDPRSLASAARAHSRLHQAAVLALSSITARVFGEQIYSFLHYLTTHGEHITSIDLQGSAQPWGATLLSLPHSLQRLGSLTLSNLRVQLQPNDLDSGILWDLAPLDLKQLRLSECMLLDEDPEEGLAVALSLLGPTLKHLSLRVVTGAKSWVGFLSDALQASEQLTYLELGEGSLRLNDPVGLRHLQGLTRLQDLRLRHLRDYNVTASMLAGLCQLSRLELHGNTTWQRCTLDPGALAGKTQLQHLALVECNIPGGAGGVAQLLLELQQLQRLTHLHFLHRSEDGDPAAAAAYAGLTASSRLQLLDVSCCMLQAGVWQHVFPAGRQLPHLQVLDVSCTRHPDGPAAAPEGTRLVSCCPGLQSLQLSWMLYSAELLAPLQRLSGLRKLSLHPADESSAGLEVVCQLTGLRELEMKNPREDEGLLLRLTQLKHLTALTYSARRNGTYFEFNSEASSNLAPGDEPVWRQVLRHHLDHSDPEVAHEAAATLAEQ